MTEDGQLLAAYASRGAKPGGGISWRHSRPAGQTHCVHWADALSRPTGLHELNG